MVEADLYQTTKKLALWFDASLSTVSFAPNREMDVHRESARIKACPMAL